MTTGQQVTIKSGSYTTHGTVVRVCRELNLLTVKTSLPYDKCFRLDTLVSDDGASRVEAAQERFEKCVAP